MSTLTEKLIEALTSKKLWATIAACAGVYAAEGKAGLWKMVSLVMAYLVSQGAVDVAAKINPPGSSTVTTTKTQEILPQKDVTPEPIPAPPPAVVAPATAPVAAVDKTKPPA